MTIIVNLTGFVPVSSFTRDVMMYLPGIPTWEVEYRAKQALRDFCRDTQIWQQRNTVLLTTVAGQEVYDAALPAGVELYSVISAWDGEDEVAVELPGEAENQAPSVTDSCWLIGVADVDTLRLTPAPDTTGIALVGTVCFAPNEDSTQVPSVLYSRWRDGIAAGIKATCMEQVGKPWSNPQQAPIERRKFRQAIKKAANQTGPTKRRPLRVTPW